jgi:hypothetical protein
MSAPAQFLHWLSSNENPAVHAPSATADLHPLLPEWLLMFMAAFETCAFSPERPTWGAASPSVHVSGAGYRDWELIAVNHLLVAGKVD